jgi:hypothetical protein
VDLFTLFVVVCIVYTIISVLLRIRAKFFSSPEERAYRMAENAWVRKRAAEIGAEFEAQGGPIEHSQLRPVPSPSGPAQPRPQSQLTVGPPRRPASPSTQAGLAPSPRTPQPAPRPSPAMARSSPYEATVRLPNGRTQRVRVTADDGWQARSMLEAQYGPGCVWGGGPQKVR